MNDFMKELIHQLDKKENQIIELLQRIEKAIEYINEYCIDDEFYVNLTKKEKSIFDVLNILRGE